MFAEYVANAWGAGTTEVNIEIPTDGKMEDYSISASDNGYGVSVEDVNEKFWSSDEIGGRRNAPT